MYKINRNKSKRVGIPIVIPYIVGISITIGGILSVPKYSKCDITETYHAHLFTKDINGTKIQKWLPAENSFSYNKSDTFIKTTSTDIKALEKLDEKNLFEGIINIDYINRQILKNRDYLKFFYRYEEVYYEEDEDGNRRERRVEHSGWSTNPRHEGVTGKVRVYHTRYYAYKLTYDNDSFSIEKSNGVDDVREILNEYPYINETSAYEVYETFRFRIRELPYLEVDDISPFTTPTIENNPLDNYSSNYQKIKRHL